MPQGQKNLYQCNTCQGQIVTLDLVDGTTPFILPCYVTPGCEGDMHSAFYNNIHPRVPFQFEWFKPQTLDGYDEDTREHIRKGGLVLQRRQLDLRAITDPSLLRVIQSVRLMASVSISDLQRMLKSSYQQAAPYMIALIQLGVIFSEKNSKGQHLVVLDVNWKTGEPA